MNEHHTGTSLHPDGQRVVAGLLPVGVFGPIDSRRFGLSLGVNVIPAQTKVCSFDCCYCECGPSALKKYDPGGVVWPDKNLLCESLENYLTHHPTVAMALAAITFSGNGEPTLHPEFEQLIDCALLSRDRHAPHTKLVVLTNASELSRSEIRRALAKVDEPCIKLDAGNDALLKSLNYPLVEFHLQDLIKWCADLPQVVIQTIFVQGPIDNTTPEAIDDWIDCLRQIRPRRVDIYTLHRKPVDLGLRPVEMDKLNQIAEQVRVMVQTPVQVY